METISEFGVVLARGEMEASVYGSRKCFLGASESLYARHINTHAKSNSRAIWAVSSLALLTPYIKPVKPFLHRSTRRLMAAVVQMFMCRACHPAVRQSGKRNAGLFDHTMNCFFV